MSWTDQPTLSGRYVTLRPLSRDDRSGILAAFAEGLESVFATFVPDEASIDGWYADRERETAAGRSVPFTVLDADGRTSGVTRFMRMAPSHRRLEIGGTVYARRVQRTGLNTEAKLLLLTYAFETLDCVCVQFRTDFLNRSSRRAIERLGARLDGVLRGHLLSGDHRRDTAVYSIQQHEWPGVRRNLDALLAAHGERL